jgi:hypothetical protein
LRVAVLFVPFGLELQVELYTYMITFHVKLQLAG